MDLCKKCVKVEWGEFNIELKKICLLCVFVPLLLNKMDHILIHLNLGRVK